jgi:uncharacterized protein YvpB
MKKLCLILILIVLAVVGILFAGRFLNQKEQKERQNINQTVPTPSPLKSPKIKKEQKIIKIPDQINLDVPFISQAPHADWRMPYQEACEEAALIMIHHYLRGERGGEMNKNLANSEILEMVAWQEKNWGGHYDLPAQEIGKLAKEYYSYKNIEVIYDISIEDIKRKLSQKNPVIVPAAGRLLANPYFTPPGPVYHNLVIVGYDQNGFITNDPGVWQGHKFRYTYENLFSSIHDFVPGTTKINPSPILNGQKVIIIIKSFKPHKPALDSKIPIPSH